MARRLMETAVLVALAVIAAAPATQAGTASQWKNRVIYQLLTDRFATDGQGQAQQCGDLSNYCGGKWSGVTQNMNYITGLGANAVWISPIPSNTDGGYHGYWQKDLRQLNSNYGSNNDLSTMVQALQRNDVWVMLDIVVNHMGNQDNGNFNDFSSFYPFNDSSHYHSYCQINNWDDPHQVEFCRLANLPDLAQENSFVASTLETWIANIQKTYKFDGIRIDTVLEVPLSYWATYASKLDVYTIGEVDNGDPKVNAPVQGALDATLNYPMYWALRHALQEKQSMQVISSTWAEEKQLFKDVSVLGLFLDNHDNPRFLSINPDQVALQNGLAYILFGEGIPIIYYGTEQGFDGSDDPQNREDLWRSSYDTSAPLYKYIQALLAVRSKLPPSFFAAEQEEKYVLDQLYVYQRDTVLVAITNGGSGFQISQAVPDLDYSDGTTLVNVLDRSDTISVEGGTATVTITDGTPKVYMASTVISPLQMA